jgi:hypothetical protein
MWKLRLNEKNEFAAKPCREISFSLTKGSKPISLSSSCLSVRVPVCRLNELRSGLLTWYKVFVSRTVNRHFVTVCI